jgi:hypothetical protein
MAETVYNRFKRTGYVGGPHHGLLKRMADKEEKPKANGSVVMKQKQSIDGRRQLIQAALAPKVKKGEAPSPAEAWIKEISDDIAIFECPVDRTTKGISYSIKDGKVELGEPFDVEVQYAKL